MNTEDVKTRESWDKIHQYKIVKLFLGTADESLPSTMY